MITSVSHTHTHTHKICKEKNDKGVVFALSPSEMFILKIQKLI